MTTQEVAFDLDVVTLREYLVGLSDDGCTATHITDVTDDPNFPVILDHRGNECPLHEKEEQAVPARIDLSISFALSVFVPPYPEIVLHDMATAYKERIMNALWETIDQEHASTDPEEWVSDSHSEVQVWLQAEIR